jgi:uncharacterized membrane protein YbaN (DUF454 family)
MGRFYQAQTNIKLPGIVKTDTIVKKFNHVLDYLNRLSVNNIKPEDPQFTTVHQKLQESHFSPHFHGAIRAIDGTHISVIVPSSTTITHFGWYRHTTQNVMVVCDFDMRFTFVVVGWTDSVHDTRVFNEALQKYVDKFSFPLEGINIIIVLFIVCTQIFSLTFVINVQGSTTLLTLATLIRRVFFRHTRERRTIYWSFDRLPHLVVRKKCLITCTHHYAM